jgi:hypothetical protein
MRLLVLSAAIAATVLGALPASAEVVVREGGSKIVVGGRDHDNDMRRHHRRCHQVTVRKHMGDRVVVRTRQVCD